MPDDVAFLVSASGPRNWPPGPSPGLPARLLPALDPVSEYIAKTDPQLGGVIWNKDCFTCL